MARQHAQGLQRQDAVEIGSDFGKDLVEDPAQGEDGGTHIEMLGTQSQLPQLAPGLRSGIDQGHGQTPVGQQEGAHQTAYPGADHHHTFSQGAPLARCHASAEA